MKSPNETTLHNPTVVCHNVARVLKNRTRRLGRPLTEKEAVTLALKVPGVLTIEFDGPHTAWIKTDATTCYARIA